MNNWKWTTLSVGLIRASSIRRLEYQPWHIRFLDDARLTRGMVQPISPVRGMKRKASGSQISSRAKRQRDAEPEYCDVKPEKDDNGIVWPAPVAALERARGFLKEWYA